MSRTHENVIATSWFTGKPDIRNRTRTSESHAIDRWRNCILEHGLNGIIFHDCFSDELVSDYTTDNLKFVYDDFYKDSPLHIIDYRWYMYYRYFANTDYERIFFTDCQDVIITHNFFHQVNDLLVYISEEYNSWPRVGKWGRNNLLPVFPKWPFKKPLLNPGLMGGHRNKILPFINELLAHIDLVLKHPKHRCPYADVLAVNALARKHYKPEQLFSGEPMHSLFKKWQHHRKDVWFIHK
jgi:hypothetical protein